MCTASSYTGHDAFLSFVLSMVLFLPTPPASFPSAFQLHILHYPSLFPTSPKISSPHHHPFSNFRPTNTPISTLTWRGGVRTGGCVRSRLHTEKTCCCLSLACFPFLLWLFFSFFLEDAILLYCLDGSTIFLSDLEVWATTLAWQTFKGKPSVLSEKTQNNLAFQIAYQNNQHTFPIF